MAAAVPETVSEAVPAQPLDVTSDRMERTATERVGRSKWAMRISS